MKIDKRDVAVYLGFLAITLAFFFRLLDGREVLAFKDLSRYFYPLRFLMVEVVKSGQLPLWNPYIFCGLPFMATLQVGFFYPLTIIHYILPFDLAFNYYTILHYYLAAVFMYWLMRHYQLSRPAAFLSGLLFAFSGYMLSVSNMNTTLTSVIWLPLVILCWDKSLTPPFGHPSPSLMERGTKGVRLVLALALMFLGGEPTIIYVTGWLMLGYALFLYPDRLRNIGKLALAFVVAALLLSAQLLPFLELLWHSDRGMLSNFQSISNWSFPPREILNFIFPFFFGNPLRAGNYTEILLGKEVQTWLLSPYAGGLAILLAGLALFKKEKRHWVFAGAGIFALLLAFGRYTPVYFLFYKLIPGISFIRYPVKYLFVTSFALAYLAGWGAEEVGKAPKMKKYLWLLLAGMGGLTLALNLFKLQIFSCFNYLYPKGLPTFFIDELWGIYSFDIGSLNNLFIILTVFAIAVWLTVRKYISKPVFRLLLISLIALDLFAVNTSLIYPVDRSAYHYISENLKILSADRSLFRIFYSPRVEHSSRTLAGLDYRQALNENLDRLTANRLIPYGLYDYSGYESIELKDYRETSRQYEQGMPLKLTNEFNIKYAATENPIHYPGYRLLRKVEYFNGRLYLYRNDNYLPRAFIAGRNERCEILRYSPQEVLIKADLKAPGQLVLSDTYYPGWRVWINGKEGRILRANQIARAVELEKGKSMIRFSYDPISFKLGLFLSGLTILALAGWGFQAKKH